jgi:hypothetical protein
MKKTLKIRWGVLLTLSIFLYGGMFGQSNVEDDDYYSYEELRVKSVPSSILNSWGQMKVVEKIEFTQHWETVLSSNEETGIEQGVTSSTVVSACDNIGFENGDFTNWDRITGDYYSCCSNYGGAQALVSNGVDYYGGFPVKFPGSLNNYSVMLGNTSVNSIADQLQFEFIVTADTKFVEYNYAVVFEDPNHPLSAQPKFESAFYKNGIEIPCSKFEATAQNGLPGFSVSQEDSGVLFKPWTRVVVDLSSYIDDTITVKFTNRDCGYGAHFGYSYLDASCMPINSMDVIVCDDEICAPPYYGDVSWTGHGYNNYETECIPRPTNDGTYQYLLNLVTNDPNCPIPTLYYNVDVVTSIGEYVKNGSLDDGLVPSINLIPGLETARGQINRVKDWIRATGDPDLFDIQFKECLPSQLPDLNLCGLSPVDATCVGIPCNHFGYQDHRLRQDSGRYVGLYQAVGIDFDPLVPVRQRNILRSLFDERVIVEGAQTELVKPLDPGVIYEFSMFVNRAEKGEEGTDLLLSDNAYYVIKMGESPASNELLLYDQTEADVVYVGKVSDTLNWVNIAFDLKVDKPYDWLIIESYPAGFVHELFGVSSNDVTQISTNEVKNRLQEIMLEVRGFLDSGYVDTAALLNIPKIQSYMYFDDVSLQVKCGSEPSDLVADAGGDHYLCTDSGIGILGGLPAALGGVAPYHYSWSTSDGLDDAFVANPQFSAARTIKYTLRVVDANGDVATDDVWVYVGGLDIDLGGSIALCNSNCFNLGANFSYQAGSGNFSYQWSQIAGSTVTITGANTKYAQVCVSAGVSEFKLVVTDNVSGCSTEEVIEVAYNPGGNAELVSNGEFSNAQIPTLRGQIENAVDWNAALGSPDLFHEYSDCFPLCADHNDVGIPNNNFGYKAHINSGDEVYSGVYTNVTLPNVPGLTINDNIDTNAFAINVAATNPMFSSEAIYQVLENDLENDKTYTLNLDAGLAGYGEINKKRIAEATSSITIGSVSLSTEVYVVAYLSNEKFDDSSPKLLIPDDSQIVINQRIGNSQDWYHLNKTFRAQRNWSTLVVFTLNQGELSVSASGIPGGSSREVPVAESFTYLDNISIAQACGVSLPQSLVEKSANSQSINNLFEVEKEKQFSIGSSSQANQIAVVSKAGEIENLYYVLRDVSGSEIQRGVVLNNGQINHHLSSGIYFLEILSGINHAEVHRVLID